MDLSCIIEPLQGYLLSNVAEGNFFANPESFSICLELSEGFCDNTLQRGYNVWEYVSLNDYENLYAKMAKSFNPVKLASDVDSSSSVSAPAFIPEKLPEQRHPPTQRPRTDLAKTQLGVSPTLVADRFRSVPKHSDADSS